MQVFGARSLALLSDEATLNVLVQLSRRPSSALDIESAVPGLSYKVAQARLRKLLTLDLVEPVDRRRAARARQGRTEPHRLRQAGRAIQPVIQAAADCEAAWPTRARPFAPRGAEALAVAGDRSFRAIARVLAHQRLRLKELESLLPEISHGTLQRRLREREALGLIHSEKDGREAWQSLTDDARRLATVAIYAGRWDWLYGHLDGIPFASDLAGQVHQLAPLVSIPHQFTGICRLHEDWPTTVHSDVYLAAKAGRLTAFVVAPLEHPQASARGTPHQWAQALLTDDPSPISITGDEPLLHAIIAAFHRELSAARHELAH